jgi:type I restriction enzyme R subunit
VGQGRQGVDRRRRRLRDRARQAGRDQRRLHPHARREVPAAKGDGEDREIKEQITRAIDASPSLRNKKDLIEEFVESVSASGSVDEEWEAFISARRAEELAAIVADESLNPAETQAFVDMAFRDGAVPTTGTGITKILPPASRFAGPGAGHADKKRRVLEKLTHYLDRYLGLGGSSATARDELGNGTLVE